VGTEKGRKPHEKGRTLPVWAGESGGGEAYAAAVAAALRSELGGTRSAAKSLMRWTGASERTAKAWLGGISGPSGEHLIALLRNSDAVFALVLRLSGRAAGSGPGELLVVRRHLLDALAALNRVAGDMEGSIGT
jgi:hypothetical protein